MSQLSFTLVKNAIENIVRVKLGKTDHLKPLMFTYFVNSSCNFDCEFCPYAITGITKTPIAELSTEDTLQLFALLKKECPHLYLSGGEPLLRKDIVELVSGAKALGFKSIMMVSNMSVIHKRLEVLDSLTNVIASVNMLDSEAYSEVVGVRPEVIDQTLKNVELCAKLREQKGFSLTVNFVANKKTLPHLDDVLALCLENDIHFTMGPELDMEEKVSTDLVDSELYQSTIEKLKLLKQRSSLILDSNEYFSLISQLSDFDCYPTLIPRIYPNGDLAYPCKPLSSARVSVLKSGTYSSALKEGVRQAGPLPMCKGKCFQNCYTQPSQLVKTPFKAIRQLFNW